MSQQSSQYDSEELFKLAQWHMLRYDALRSSTANRASVALSANALLLAAGGILLGQYFQELDRISLTAKILLSCGAGINLLLISWSMVNAARALISLRSSRELFGYDIPQRLVFHHPDTVKAAHSFQDFRRIFVDQSRAEALDYAVGELWTVIKQHNYRYQKLRRAVRMLLLATATLLVTIFLAVVLAFTA